MKTSMKKFHHLIHEANTIALPNIAASVMIGAICPHCDRPNNCKGLDFEIPADVVAATARTMVPLVIDAAIISCLATVEEANEYLQAFTQKWGVVLARVEVKGNPTMN